MFFIKTFFSSYYPEYRDMTASELGTIILSNSENGYLKVNPFEWIFNQTPQKPDSSRFNFYKMDIKHLIGESGAFEC